MLAAAAHEAEVGVIASVWASVQRAARTEPLHRAACTEHEVHALAKQLPDVTALEPGRPLQQLLQLHLDAASALMTALRQLVPRELFQGGTAAAALAAGLEPEAASAAAVLIDAQLLHLQRAALLSAYNRLHLRTPALSKSPSTASTDSMVGLEADDA